MPASRFAATCGLSRSYLSQVLRGHAVPGEFARFKLLRGMAILGITTATESASTTSTGREHNGEGAHHAATAS